MNTGDVIKIYPYEGKITNEAGATISTFSLKPETILDEVRAGVEIIRHQSLALFCHSREG
jgi:aconitate hydratase 2/2-methylisocitrate dehydratase